MSRHDYTRAFTLIEIMVTTAILSTVFMFLAMVMQSASSELEVSMPDAALQGEMQQAIQRIVDELEDASASSPGNLEVAPDGSWIKFRVPVDVDTWVPGNAISWGARRGRMQESDGGLNWIVFVQGRDRRSGNLLLVDEGTVVSGGLNVNINTEETKDLNDVFIVGHLLFVYDSDGTYNTVAGDPTKERRLTGDWVAQAAGPSGPFGGDVDGAATDDIDAVPDDILDYEDPIFRLDTTGTKPRVVVNLWGLCVVRARRVPILMNRRASVVLTNP